MPGYRRRAGMPASHPQGHRVVYVLGHPQTATVPEAKHKKVCTCPSFEDFLADYEKGGDDDFDVKVTDANRPEHIGGRTFERVKELELHFECEALPSKNERSFGSMFIMACPNLEYLHIKGHADGSIIRTVAVYNSQRPAKLTKIKFDETVMVHDRPTWTITTTATESVSTPFSTTGAMVGSSSLGTTTLMGSTLTFQRALGQGRRQCPERPTLTRVVNSIHRAVEDPRFTSTVQQYSKRPRHRHEGWMIYRLIRRAWYTGGSSV